MRKITALATQFCPCAVARLALAADLLLGTLMRKTTFLALLLAVTVAASRAEVNSEATQLDSYAVFYKLSKEDAWNKAHAMAQRDFARNVYRIFVYGLRPVKSGYDDYLKEKYGVLVTPIAGCIVSAGILGATDGYNSTMEPLLKHKFGHDIFQEAKEASAR